MFKIRFFLYHVTPLIMHCGLSHRCQSPQAYWTTVNDVSLRSVSLNVVTFRLAPGGRPEKIQTVFSLVFLEVALRLRGNFQHWERAKLGASFGLTNQESGLLSVNSLAQTLGITPLLLLPWLLGRKIRHRC